MASGTPQARWREMHQSGRASIMLVMRCSPQAGIHSTPRMAVSAVARKITGDLWRQQWG
jgi:hypothetical protein